MRVMSLLFAQTAKQTSGKPTDRCILSLGRFNVCGWEYVCVKSDIWAAS